MKGCATKFKRFMFMVVLVVQLLSLNSSKSICLAGINTDDIVRITTQVVDKKSSFMDDFWYKKNFARSEYKRGEKL